jgi:hypothetical protein
VRCPRQGNTFRAKELHTRHIDRGTIVSGCGEIGTRSVQRNTIDPIIDDPLGVETTPVMPGIHTQR